jgi:hypothetical protein
MAQVDMKMSAEEVKEYTEPSVGDAPEYPYGLRISLDDDALEKLGLTQLPAVGTKMQLSATVEVCSTSAYSTQEGESEASVSLQITAMELGSAQQSTSAASMLYGGDND